MALQSVLFAPVNVAGQTSARLASPFTVAVFEHYLRLSCHLESKSELYSTTVKKSSEPQKPKAVESFVNVENQKSIPPMYTCMSLAFTVIVSY